MRPTLLVHGYLATPDLMRPLRSRLRARGRDVYLVRELGPLVMGDVRRHAEELDRAVDRVCAQTGASQVDVVGASQGGLIALWWATHGGWERLGRLVALGTPFRGSPAARFGRALLGRVSPGIRQLVPGADLLTELEGLELERPVVSVSMRGDPVCPPEVCVLPGMESIVVDASFGPLSHQLLMLDPRAADAVFRGLEGLC
ncbi:MAG: alpha/beta fold hydrolase [Myxococcota bacterium]